MAEKVLSIEIGPNLTKVAETDHKEGNVVYNAFYFETPSEMVNNGVVRENNAFRLSLEEGLKKCGIKTRKVVFVIQATSIGSREEVLPKMKEARIKDFIQTNTSQFFQSIDPDKYRIVYRENGAAAESEKIRAQLFAVSKEIIASYERLADACNLILMDIELLENGLARAMRTIYPVGSSVNINVESVCSYLTIVKNGEIMLQRVIPYGIDEAVLAVMETESFGRGRDIISTIKEMRKTRCFAPSLDDADEDSGDVVDVATLSVEQLIGNISRFLDYYISQHSQDSIDRIIVSGFGTYFEGFRDLVGHEISQNVESAETTLIPRINNKGAIIDVPIFVSTVLAGSNTNGIGIDNNASAGFTLSARDDDDFSVAKKFFVVCAVVFVLLIAIPLVIKAVYTSKYNKLADEIASLQEAKQVHDEYSAMKTKYDDIISLDENTVVANDSFLKLLNEMENQLPTEVRVTALSADSSGIVIEFETESKNIAANTISVLRNLESIKDISCSEIKSSSDDSGRLTYTFSVSGYYNSPADATEDEQTVDANQTVDQAAQTDANAAAQTENTDNNANTENTEAQ